MPKINMNVVCTRSNCFANKGTLNCRILSEAIFGECPFYKTQEQVDEGREKAYKRLIELGRYDLLQQYDLDQYNEEDEEVVY